MPSRSGVVEDEVVDVAAAQDVRRVPLGEGPGHGFADDEGALLSPIG